MGAFANGCRSPCLFLENILIMEKEWLYGESTVSEQFNKENNSSISNLNDFYNTELTKNRDIRNLSKEYTSFDAQKDNCFVIGAMVHNDNLYSEFMENYKNKKRKNKIILKYLKNSNQTL